MFVLQIFKSFSQIGAHLAIKKESLLKNHLKKEEKEKDEATKEIREPSPTGWNFSLKHKPFWSRRHFLIGDNKVCMEI